MNPRILIITASIMLIIILLMVMLLPDDGPGSGEWPMDGSSGVAGIDDGGAPGIDLSGSGSSRTSGTSGNGSSSARNGGGSDSGPDGNARRFGDERGNAARSNDPSSGGRSESGIDQQGNDSRDDGGDRRGSNGSTGSRNGRGSSNSNGRGSQQPVPDGMARVMGELMLEEAPASLLQVSGQLQIGTAAGSRSIPVSGGRFNTLIDQNGTIEFFGAVLESRPARVVAPSGAIRASAAGNLRIIIRYDALTMLHLKSVETGEPLTNIEVIRVQDYSRSSLPHPGWSLPQDAKIVTDESPVALDGRIGSIGSAVAIHARAAGHQWRRITVDLVAGGERELSLERSGSTMVRIFGDVEREGVVLRIREQGRVGSPHSEIPVTGITEKLLEGLLPGSWTATLESGHWAHQPEIFDEVAFDLEAGGLLELELEIPLDDEERVDLAGTVYIPEGWDLDNFSVRVRPTGPGTDPINDTIEVYSNTMQSTSVAGGFLWEWGPVQVKPGTFSILVLPVGVGGLFEVPDGGLLDASIELPAAVDVTVQAVLADGSGNAFPSLIRWAPLRPPGTPGAGAVPVGDAANGLFMFQAPVGNMIISCSDVNYRPTHQQVEVTMQGPNEFVLELEPAVGMRLYLEEAGTSVPWDLSWHPSVEAIGHDGVVVTRGRTGNGYRVLVSEPGQYLVVIPDLSGFLPVDPFPAMVVDGEVIEEVVEIQSE